MDGTCLSQARCGWALSQLPCTASPCQYPLHPTCQPRAGFSIGRDKFFDIKPGCLRFRISLKVSQCLGHEMFSKGQTEALSAITRPPSVWAYIPQGKKPMSGLHYPDLPTLNHQYCEVPTVPKFVISVESLDIIRAIFKFCGTWKRGPWLKDPICFSEGSWEDVAFPLTL